MLVVSLGLGEFVDLEFKIVEDRVRDLKDILMSYFDGYLVEKLCGVLWSWF